MSCLFEQGYFPIQLKSVEFSIHVAEWQLEVSVCQILGPNFCFMKSRKLYLKIHRKFPILSRKIKSKT